MISAIVSGRLGRDAETRKAGQTTVTSFSLASNAYRNKEKTTDWVNVSFWGDRSEKLAQYLTKGAYVVARGTLYVREYEGKDGGLKFSLDLRADDIELGGGQACESGGRGSGGGGGSRTQSKRQEPAPADDFGEGGMDDIPF